MNRFSAISQARLLTCHRDLRVLFAHVILDYDCSVLCGIRKEKEQNEAYKSGNSKVKFPNSKHNSNPSMAIDVAPFEMTAIDWDLKQCIYFAGQVKGIANQLFRTGVMTYRLKTGIDWDNDNDINDTKFWDACHFELIQ